MLGGGIRSEPVVDGQRNQPLRPPAACHMVLEENEEGGGIAATGQGHGDRAGGIEIERVEPAQQPASAFSWSTRPFSASVAPG